MPTHKKQAEFTRCWFWSFCFIKWRWYDQNGSLPVLFKGSNIGGAAAPVVAPDFFDVA
jgi:hypothetical protein